jgi:hypothetical protein
MVRIHNDLSGKEYIPYIDDTIEVPRRLYIFTKHLGSITIGSRTVAWLPILGVMPPSKWYWWWPITYEPPRRFHKRGLLARRHPEWYGLKPEMNSND